MSELKAKLLLLEQHIDAEVGRLPVLQLPVRALLTVLHLALDGLANGSRFGGSQAADAAKRDSLLSRISYLTDLLKKSPLEPLGASAANALAAYEQDDPTGEQTLFLLHYAHLCEEMPKVHKGYLQVTSIVENHVLLQHATDEFAVSETKDIILSELAGSLMLSGLNRLEKVFDKIAAQAPELDNFQADMVLTILYRHYQQYVFTVDLLPEAGFMAATGVSRDVFYRFRAALFAIADFCDGIAAALARKLNAGGPPSDEALAGEMLEWISVFWLENRFRELMASQAQLTPAQLDSLLTFFLLNLDAAKFHAAHAGDGFTPPLFQLSNSILFNPSLVRGTVAERNILFGLNRLDRQKFDNVVSQHLEPKLLADAASLLKHFKELVLVSNFVWDQGEIDLLVYSPSENAALHIQAKASLPPEGARMIRATEDRVKEGLSQLAAFRRLKPERQDAILFSALAQPVRNVIVVDAILARTCFGTHRIWAQAASASFITLPLLALLLAELQNRNESFSVLRFPTLLDELLSGLIAAADPHWESEVIELGKVSVAVPMLKYNHDALIRARMTTHQVFGRYLV